MALTVEIFEDSGALTLGHGTTRIITDNIGWKSSGLDETNHFVFYPLRRPDSGFTYSFIKYTYFKISGTYAKASRPRIIINHSLRIGGECIGRTKLYYKLTNTYAEPTNAFDGSMIYIPPDDEEPNIRLYPRTSTVGPEVATTYNQYLNTNTTYYTEYFVTQLFVHTTDYVDPEVVAASIYGNISSPLIKFEVDEYESTTT